MLAFESHSYPGIHNEKRTNIIWSAHYTERCLKTGSFAERMAEFDRKEKLAAATNVQIPIFIGEAKAPEDNAASAAELGKAMNDRGWRLGASGPTKASTTAAGPRPTTTRALKYNLAEDSYESILDRWTTGLSQWHDPSKNTNLHPERMVDRRIWTGV